MAYCDPIKTEPENYWDKIEKEEKYIKTELENCWDKLETEEKHIVEEESVVPESYTEDKNVETYSDRKNDLTETLAVKRESTINCPKVFRYRLTNEPRYKCEICKKAYYLPKNLRKHEMSHTGQKPHKCEICEATFRRFKHLKLHLLCHTGEMPYKCKICQKAFHLSQNLRKHEKCHKGQKHEMCHKGQKTYKCEICEATLRSLKGLKLHKMRHTGEMPYKCEICQKAFRVPCGLRYHMESHTDQRPHKCEICQKAYRLPRNLTSHMFSHTDARFYTCEFCGKGSWTESWLSTHVCPTRRSEQANVEGRDPFQCPTCLKRFIDLKTHMQIHTREKPYTCEICQERFEKPSALNKHMKSHSVEKPFECQTCGKRLGCRKNLKKHMKTHEKKSFDCSVCSRTFNCPRKLEKHSFIHTGEMPCSKSVLNRKFTKGHEAVQNTPELEKAIIKPDEIQIDEGGPELQINANSKLVDEEVYNCEFCEENVISKAAFKYHMEEAHFVILEEIGVDC